MVTLTISSLLSLDVCMRDRMPVAFVKYCEATLLALLWLSLLSTSLSFGISSIFFFSNKEIKKIHSVFVSYNDYIDM